MSKSLSPNPLKLSVVLAVHNEAATLFNCLRAIKDIADEIIIVDGESTDQTVQIARDFGATVISTTNKLNFHINKQLAVDAATGDIIFQLDADEVADPELVGWLEQLKHDATSTVDGWWVRRHNYFLGDWLRKGGQYPDRVIRVFRRGRASFPQQSVHEQILVMGETAEAIGHLEHFSTPSLAVYLAKMQHYTTLSAHDLAKSKITLPAAIWRLLLVQPMTNFFLLWIRHKGLLDGWRGFLFAVLSSWHHPLTFLKWYELKYVQNLSTSS